MNFRKEYYKILGVSTSCSKEELKSAYRHLAKQYHPDKSSGADPDKMIDINEAYEVLGDPAKKAIYDAYISAKNSTQSTVDSNASAKTTNHTQHSAVKMYERKTTISKLEKLYVKGRIHVKYWAESLEDYTAHFHEMNYRLQATEVKISLEEKDIGIRELPEGWLTSIEELELFQTPIGQPVRCEIFMQGEIVHYRLDLVNIRVGAIELLDIVKYNDQSLGTLTGNIYAEVHHTTFEEQTEWVTECFGPTGKTEIRQEDNWNWKRTEYYHADCTTYWSDWEKTLPVFKSNNRREKVSKTGTKQDSKFKKSHAFAKKQAYSLRITEPGSWIGCAPLLTLFLLILFFLGMFQAGIPTLAFFITLFLVVLVTLFFYWIRKVIPVLYLILITGLIISSIWSSYVDSHRKRFPNSKPANSNVVLINDSLIVHTITWKGFDSVLYSIDLPVSKDRIIESNTFQRNLTDYKIKDIGAIYNALYKFDEESLDAVYDAFDSLRKFHQLKEEGFADLMVSCIQSIPYSLVLSGSCNSSSYIDNSVEEYLQQCEKDCCVGNTAYGVRSPITFLSDLKGDCDTRALLLFALFKKFNYDVAIITSEQFRHAAIAVGVNNVISSHPTTFRMDDINLYAWETTSFGFRIGELPDKVRNPGKWKISLLHKKYENESQE
jgi:hypothetical protein